jgi:hypothetical protein
MCSRRFRDSFCIHLHGQSEQRSYSGYLVSGPWEPGLKEKVPVPGVGRHDRYRGNVTDGPMQCSQGRKKNCISFACFINRQVLTKHVSPTLFCGSTGVRYACVEHTYFFSSVIRQISEEVVFACTCVKCVNDASATETRGGLCVALALCHLQMYEH